ncbi:MAG TPA: hypothetical protein VIL85_02840 [Thermomicrobiales bacterium]
MQQQSTELTKRTIIASLPWAAGFAGILFVTGFIPCCGFLLFPAGAVGIAYLIVPKLGLYPTPETKNSLALNTGIGIGVTTMGSLVIATLLSQLIGFAFIGITGAMSRDIGGLTLGLSFGLLSLIGYLAYAIIGGLAIGTVCGFLGSLLALDRTQPAQYY